MNDILKEALDFAITKEKEAETFYKTWSNQVSNPAIQKLFTDLAEMERGHAEKLSRIAPEELIAQGPVPADLKLSEVLVEVEAQPNMTLQDALIVAMKREEAAVALYPDFDNARWGMPLRRAKERSKRARGTTVGG